MANPRASLIRFVIMLGLFAVSSTFSISAEALHLEVVSTPPLGSTNFLKNPGFEKEYVREGASFPQDWLFTANPADAIICAQLSETAFAGKRSLYMQTDSGDKPGYWIQWVRGIKPGEKLLLSSWVKLNSGKVHMSVVAYDITKVPSRLVFNKSLYLTSAMGNPLYPVFVKAEHLRDVIGTEWGRRRFFLTNAEGAGGANIVLGMLPYSTPGEVWFDDVYFGPATISLSVRATSEGGIPIKRVAIFDDMGSKVYDSGEISTMTFQEILDVPADSAYYKVEVVDTEGNVITEGHPG